MPWRESLDWSPETRVFTVLAVCCCVILSEPFPAPSQVSLSPCRMSYQTPGSAHTKEEVLPWFLLLPGLPASLVGLPSRYGGQRPVL